MPESIDELPDDEIMVAEMEVSAAESAAIDRIFGSMGDLHPESAD